MQWRVGDTRGQLLGLGARLRGLDAPRFLSVLAFVGNLIDTVIRGRGTAASPSPSLHATAFRSTHTHHNTATRAVSPAHFPIQALAISVSTINNGDYEAP